MTENTGAIRQKSPMQVAEAVFNAGLSLDWVSLIKARTQGEARNMLGRDVYKAYIQQLSSVKARSKFDEKIDSLGVPEEVANTILSDSDKVRQIIESTVPAPDQDAVGQLKHAFLKRKVLLVERGKIQEQARIKRDANTERIRVIEHELKGLKGKLNARVKEEGYDEDKIKADTQELTEEKEKLEKDSKEILASTEKIAVQYMTEVNRISGLLVSTLYENAHRAGHIDATTIAQLRLARRVACARDIMVLEKKRRAVEGTILAENKPKGYNEADMQKLLQEHAAQIKILEQTAGPSADINDESMLQLYEEQYNSGIITMLDFRRHQFESLHHYSIRSDYRAHVKHIFETWPPKPIGVDVEAHLTSVHQSLHSLGPVVDKYEKVISERLNDILITCPPPVTPKSIDQHVSNVVRQVASLSALFMANPEIKDVNAVGEPHMINEILSHVLFPHYKLDMVVGFGGSRDLVNVRVPGYIIAPLSIIKACLEQNPPIRPPRLRMLNAYALAVDINRMPYKETKRIAEATDRVLHEFVKEFYPQCEQYVISDIPDLGYLQDGPVSEDAARLNDYFEELHRRFNTYNLEDTEPGKVAWVREQKKLVPKPEQDAWETEFNIWKALEGLIERGQIRLNEALKAEAQQTGQPQKQPTREQLATIKRSTFTYIAAHPWAFDNLVSFITERPGIEVPNGVIKFGGHGERNFDRMQEYLVKQHLTEDNYDALFIPTNTAGMKTLKGVTLNREVDPLNGTWSNVIDLPSRPVNITMTSQFPPYYAADRALPPEQKYELLMGAQITADSFDAHYRNERDGRTINKPGSTDLDALFAQAHISREAYAAFCTRMAQVVKARI
ncbi:MAG: hypothetical protein RI911_229 [Candidatus Parcubacteria bacterium]|jgi:hypothetical protein